MCSKEIGDIKSNQKNSVVKTIAAFEETSKPDIKVHTFHHLTLKKAFSVKIIVIVISRKAKLFYWLKNFQKQSK